MSFRSVTRAMALMMMPRPVGADARAGRVDRAGAAFGQAVGEERDVAVEVGAGAIEFLVALRGPFVVDDAAQVEPRADHLVEADVDAGEQATHLLEGAGGADRTRRRCAAAERTWATVDPGDAVVPGDDQLLADPLDLHLAPAAPDAQGLDRQQLSVAGRLGDVAGGGQVAAVEVANDLPTLVDLADIGDEYRLEDDRAAGAFASAAASMARSTSSAC